MVGDRAVRARAYRQSPRLNQFRHQLRVMQHLLADGGVLVLQRAVGVRIGGDDLVVLRLAEGVLVLLPQHLEQAFFADAPHVVARVLLGFVEDSEVQSRSLEHARRGTRHRLQPRIVGGVVADEPQILDGLLAGVLRFELQSLRPLRAGARRSAEGVSVAGEIGQGFLEMTFDVAPRNQVAAHLHNQRNVLVENRALFHAGRAGRAAPDLLALDDVAREGLRRLCRPRQFLHVVNQHFRRERIAARKTRASPVAAPAFGARQPAQQLPPGELLPPRGALGRRRHVALLERGEKHGERRRQKVHVLGVREVGEEPQDGRHVQPPHCEVQGRGSGG